MILEILAAVCLLATLGAVPRLLVGPSPADRILAAQLAGTGAVATILVMAVAGDTLALYDVALVFAVLSAVVGLSFVALKAARR